MTTGNVTSGRKVTVSGTSTTYPSYTLWKNRVWSGANSAAQAKKPKLRKKSGQWVYAYSGKKRVKLYWQSNLPVVNPNGPKRKFKTENPYSCTITTKDDPGLVRRTRPNGSNAQMVGIFEDGSIYSWDYRWTSADDYALTNKLREKVAGSDFNAGVALGEGREALAMITNSARRIYGALFAARRGNFHDAARILTFQTDRAKLWRQQSRGTANSWLEIQYGWLPLLKDAEAGAQFLAHHFNEPLQTTVRVSRRSKGVITATVNNNLRGSEEICYLQKNLKAIIREKDVAQLSGLTDPLSVAWELVPYSFVVDWFIPIGNFLSARALASALTGTFVTTTFGYRSARNHRYVYDFVGGPYQSNHTVVTVDRTVTSTLPVPLPKPKGFGEVLSWRRAANAVALLTNPAIKLADRRLAQS